MNIMIFSAIYPAPAEYGISNDTKVVHYYAKQWKNAGHNVQVVYLHMIPVKKIFKSPNPKKCFGFESEYEFDGINVHLLEYQLLIPRRNYLSAFQAKDADRRLTEFIKRSDRPDKIFVHFPCSFKGIKSITDFDCPTMAVLHNVDVGILQKREDLRDEINRYKNLGGRNKKICNAISKLLSRESSLILSGMDESLIPAPEFIERKASQSSDLVRIVYAGNLIKLKNVDVIIKALSQTDLNYQFDIIGDGPEMENLKVLADNNPRIEFKGRMSREQTVLKMREADIFIMVSSPETFGLVYLEAMAQGCITVGSKNEGIDGVIIDGKNGFLVNPGNVNELAECIKKIACIQAEPRKNIIYSAYRNANDMTDYNMAVKYLELNEETRLSIVV